MFRDCPELLWSLYFLPRHIVGFLFCPFAFVRTFLVVLRCGIFVPLPLPLVSVSVLLLLRVSLPGVHLFLCVMLPFLYYLCFLNVSRVYVLCRLVCMLLYFLPFCGMVLNFALLSFCRFAEVFFDSFSLAFVFSHCCLSCVVFPFIFSLEHRLCCFSVVEMCRFQRVSEHNR